MKPKIMRYVAVIINIAIITGIFITTAIPTSAQSNQITDEKAKKIALEYVGGGTVKEIELETKNGTSVYEVEIKYDGKKYEVKINADNGEILKSKSEKSSKTHKESDKTKTQSNSNNATATITSDEAKEIALKKVGGGTVKEIELETKNGTSVYEVEVKYNGKEYEVKINATTGEIVKYKLDD